MEVATPKEAERSEDCMNLSPGLSGIMAESLDFEERKFVWQAGRMVLSDRMAVGILNTFLFHFQEWRKSVGREMKPLYERYVELKVNCIKQYNLYIHDMRVAYQLESEQKGETEWF